ncbi:hypothetical protein F5B22DRAFT_89933 [Xylaria bambusicola]|uniref:uncharacterized protein n=1 Tax=Xylaria bambusicola TaxID=326684 RepID=UPI0020077888|nr:uncharacterized protein F5B22DRAFT_89933 [Xylaria bambusicola]KAI0518057.1 hypothetical protein F5B22DRAFT_89933 [Xylaria bambusicola]
MSLQPNKYSQEVSGRAQRPREFQIAPESGAFLSAKHQYLATFRHIECTTNIGCSTSASVVIMPRSKQGDEKGLRRWMEVCNGGCNEMKLPKGASSGGFSIRDKAIEAALYESTQTNCQTLHSQRSGAPEILNSRVVWSTDSPIPAYFSPSHNGLIPHGPEVTMGHLALMQVRGHIDTIQVDFQTPQSSTQRYKRAISKFFNRVRWVG